MSNTSNIEKIIKAQFPNMNEQEVKRLAEEYLVKSLLEKAKTMTPEAMKRELGEEY